jgi:mRNA interferase RelE/StbE
MYRIKFASQRVRKQFDKLPFSVFRRIDRAIVSLSENPFPAGVKKLTGVCDCYRIRVGDYRVTYWINHKKGEVVISRVMHRKDIYKR